ncbi:MAG: hypothetical protein M3Q65_04350, partial [Chloroflexota bacterium]|nr:hypothetical protein [Chloroflexota bacterium]
MLAQTNTGHDWRHATRREPCEACGSPDWCQVSPTLIMCMHPERVTDRAPLRLKKTRDGDPYGLYARDGRAAPTPIRTPRRAERADWTAPNAATCRALYGALVARHEGAAPSPERLAADARRFGEHAAAVRAVEDAIEIPRADHAGLLRWLQDEGRRGDAIAAGLLTQVGRSVRLAGALDGRKVYVRRRGGQVYDLRGHALDPGAEPKLLNLSGRQEDRGCAGVWYHDDLLDAAPGGHIRIAAGHAKADALNAAGLPAVFANEGSASPEQIARLGEGGIILATIHADAEEPKPGQPISEGQRKAISMGELLEAAGIAVRIAEAERPAGGPKLDADNVLRDGGPEALRALDLAAVPLATYRRRLGVEEAAPPARVAELERENATLAVALERCGAESGRKDKLIADLQTEVQAFKAAHVHKDQTVGGCLPGIGETLYEAYRSGDALVWDGDDCARLLKKDAGKYRSPGTGGRAVDTILKQDRITSHTRREPIETPTFKGTTDVDYVYIPPEHRHSPAAIMLYLLPPQPERKRHGGDRKTISVPPAVAAQADPVRRETRRVEKFISLATDEPIAERTSTPVVDFWTNTGEALTRTEADAFRVNVGAEPAPPPRWAPPAPKPFHLETVRPAPVGAPAATPRPLQLDGIDLGTRRQDDEVPA